MEESSLETLKSPLLVK